MRNPDNWVLYIHLDADDCRDNGSDMRSGSCQCRSADTRRAGARQGPTTSLIFMFGRQYQQQPVTPELYVHNVHTGNKSDGYEHTSHNVHCGPTKMSTFLFLPTALTGKVKQSVASACSSVCPSVCFHSIFWTDWPLNMSFCMCVGQDHRSKSKVKSSVYGRGNAVTRSVWSRSWIDDSFSSLNDS